LCEATNPGVVDGCVPVVDADLATRALQGRAASPPDRRVRKSKRVRVRTIVRVA
jgi:hypothetical protein